MNKGGLSSTISRPNTGLQETISLASDNKLTTGSPQSNRAVQNNLASYQLVRTALKIHITVIKHEVIEENANFYKNGN